MKHQNKISIIVVTVIAANFLFASFAFAQTKVQATVIIPKGHLEKIEAPGNTAAAQQCSVDLATKIEGALDLVSGTNNSWLTTRWQTSTNTCLFYERRSITKDYDNWLTKGTSTGWYVGSYPNRAAIRDELKNKGYILEANNEFYLRRTTQVERVEADIRAFTKTQDLTDQNYGQVLGLEEWDAGRDSDNASFLSRTVGTVLRDLIGVVTGAVMFFTGLAGELMSWMIEKGADATLRPAVIDTGWTMVRDTLNLFFIIALIVISIGTILGLEEYNYKHFLGRIIIAALLVNFSKTIAFALMDAVDVLIVFLAQDGKWTLSYYSEFAGSLTGLKDGAGDIARSKGVFSDLTLAITGLMLALMMMVTFVMMAGLLLIRMVGLWVLVILSPVAVVLQILPSTEEYAEEWIEKFVEYLIWTPISIFFLRLGSLLITEMNANEALSNNNSMFDFIIAMAFMWAAIIVAEEAGMVGGHAVINGVEKIAHKGLHGAQHMAGGYLGYKWNQASNKINDKLLDPHNGPPGLLKRAAVMALNPAAAKKAWDENAHEKQHMAKEHADAAAREAREGKYSRPHRAFLARKEEIEAAKQFAGMNLEQREDMAKSLMGDKSQRAAVLRRGLMRSAAEEGELEDMAIALRGMDQNGVEIPDYEIVGSREIADFLRRYTDSQNDHESARFIDEDIHNIGKQNKRFDYTQLTGHVHPHEGETMEQAVERAHQEHISYRAHQIGKLDGQVRAQLSPHNFTNIKVSPDGKSQEFVYSDEYKSVLAKLDQDALSQASRAQARTTHAFIPGEVKEDGVVEVNDEHELRRIQNFYRDNKEAAKIYYAKKIRVSDSLGTAQQKITGLRVRIRGQEGYIQDGSLGDPNFHFDSETRSVVQSSSNRTPSAPTPNEPAPRSRNTSSYISSSGQTINVSNRRSGARSGGAGGSDSGTQPVDQDNSGPASPENSQPIENSQPPENSTPPEGSEPPDVDSN